MMDLYEGNGLNTCLMFFSSKQLKRNLFPKMPFYNSYSNVQIRFEILMLSKHFTNGKNYLW